MEAIGEVLLRAAAMGFTEHVVIYTDNSEAAKKWKDKPLFLALSKSFTVLTFIVLVGPKTSVLISL